MTYEATLDAIAASRYAQLRTHRRDGTAVDTPIWFYRSGDTLVFRTKVGPKTRRIAAHPEVELWRCDYRGRYADGTPMLRGRATILAGAAAEQADRALHRRYGWQYNLLPLLKLPGVKNVDHALPLREKWRRVTATTVWPDSAIVEVSFDAAKALVPEHSSTPDGSPRRG
jgi:uncharacterized protein